MAIKESYSPNLNLIMPDVDDRYDVEKRNSNYRIIDTKYKEIVDKIGELPKLNTSKKDNLVNAINEVMDLASKGYTYAEIVLEAAKWSGQSYSLEDKYPSISYDIEIELSGNATKDIAKAWGKTIPVPDTSGKNIIKALGTVPAINIPIRVKVVKK